MGSAVVLFRDALLAGQVFYESDTELFYYPLTQWFAAQLRAGHLPLWMPDLFGGYPILADGEIGPLYPLKLAALLLLDTSTAFVGLRVLHFCLASTLMYALIRVLGASRLGATVAGLVFAFGGFLAAQMHHENVVRTSVWLPLVLLLAELALRRGGWPRQALLVSAGLAFGVALLGLHVQPGLMIGMALALYLACRLEVGGSRERGGAGGRLAVSRLRQLARSVLGAGWALAMIVGVAATLAAVQLLPLYEHARTSFRGQGVAYEFASAFALAPPNLTALLFPYFFRLPDGAWWSLWNHWETLLYAGVVPLLLAPLGLLRAPRRLSLYFLLLGTLSLLIAMAHYGPLNLHEALWSLPGLSFLRAPGRFSYLFVFAIAGLAAFGADWLASPARSRRSLALVASALLGLLGLLLAVLLGWRTWLLADPALARAALESSYLALRRESERLSADMVYRGLLWSVDLGNPKTLLTLSLVAALALLVLARLGGWRLRLPRPLAPWTEPANLQPRLWSLALASLVAGDLLVFAYDFHPRASLQALAQPSPLARALAELGGARLVVGPGAPALRPNRPLLAGLNDLGGYSSLPSQRHFEYWTRARAVPNVWLDLWGAGLYVAADDQRDLVVREGYRFYPAQPLVQGAAHNPAGWEAFRLPGVAAAEIHVIASLSHAVETPQGSPVAEVFVADGQGRTERLLLRAGQHLAERAYDRVDVRPAVRHSRPRVLYTTQETGADGRPFPVHFYLARLPLSEPMKVSRLVLRALLDNGELNVFGLALAGGEGQPLYLVAPTDREKFEPLAQAGAVTIYRNTKAFPRAFVVYRGVGLHPASGAPPLIQMLSSPFDPALEALLERSPWPFPAIGEWSAASGEPAQPIAARVEDLSGEHVRVWANLGQPGFVVLTDLYHRGWSATVDGQPTHVYLADSLFRAVEVPEGQHVVDFVFDPFSLRLGALLTMESLLFAGLVLGWPLLTRPFRDRRRASS